MKADPNVVIPAYQRGVVTVSIFPGDLEALRERLLTA
jgi:hypothetical protein